jgi:hypothetical protein
MQKCPIAVIAFLAISLYANHGASDTIIGLGTSSCGSWREARLSGRSFGYEQWIIGFVSGVAIALRGDLLTNNDAQGVWHWIDNYCVSHPLDLIGSATGELINVLRPQTFVRQRR